MPETPFTITRQTPHLFEVINGEAVFAIMRETEVPEILLCSYGGVANGPDSRIRWGSIPIAIRKAARAHFDRPGDRGLAA